MSTMPVTIQSRRSVSPAPASVRLETRVQSRNELTGSIMPVVVARPTQTAGKAVDIAEINRQFASIRPVTLQQPPADSGVMVRRVEQTTTTRTVTN